MERLYKGFEIIKNHFHTSNQQRLKSLSSTIPCSLVFVANNVDKRLKVYKHPSMGSCWSFR
ncbi:hypothetical protein QHH11_06715 [Aphanizomenon sp. PH219]|nr:hypothetical protein [Aphanizomenon sp. 202]MDK2458831.1 hypothetical protein [Aphanizomenon sp. PH219]